MKLGIVGINFSIFKGRAIVIAAIAALLLISTQLWEGKKEDKSTHFLKTVGSCGQPTIVKIYDETGGIDPTGIMSHDRFGNLVYTSKPVNTIENKHFKNYVATISKYVFAKVDAMGLCQQSANNPNIELTFVYRPVISSGITPYEFPPQISQNTKLLDSPWVKLTLDKSPKFNLRVVFFWNERQFLLDQLLMLEWRTSADTKPLSPIELETLHKWAQERDNSFSIKERINLARKLPADIHWIFSKYSSGRKSNKEKTIDYIKNSAEGEKIGYTDMMITLVDSTLNSTNIGIYYDNIHALKHLFNIDKYKIYPYTDDRAIKQEKIIIQEARKNQILY